jgi:hypothetical protein
MPILSKLKIVLLIFVLSRYSIANFARNSTKSGKTFFQIRTDAFILLALKEPLSLHSRTSYLRQVGEDALAEHEPGR